MLCCGLTCGRAAAACALGVDLFEYECSEFAAKLSRCEYLRFPDPMAAMPELALLVSQAAPNRLATLGGLRPRLPEPQGSLRTHKRTTEAAATLRLRVVAVAGRREATHQSN